MIPSVHGIVEKVNLLAHLKLITYKFPSSSLHALKNDLKGKASKYTLKIKSTIVYMCTKKEKYVNFLKV